MPRDRICEGAARDASSRVDDHAGGFVDDREVFVLEDDVERDVFGFEGRGRKLVELNFDLVIFTDLVRRFGSDAVDEDVAIADKAMEARAGPVVYMRGEKCIEARPGIFAGRDQSQFLLWRATGWQGHAAATLRIARGIGPCRASSHPVSESE